VKRRPNAYDGSVPLHHQIQRVLRSKIESGDWADGDRFPTESALVRRFRVSRTTIRQALSRLQHDGLIRRHRGSGSFVTLNGSRRSLPAKVTNLVLGYDAQIRVIGVDTVAAPRHVSDFLRLARGHTLRRFVRVEEVGGAPLAVVVNHLPVPLARRIRLRDLRRHSMLELLRDRLRIPIGLIRHSIEARMPDDEIASLLEISLSDPILGLRLFISDRAGRPVEVADTFYRADRYRYETAIPLPGGRASPRGRPGRPGTAARRGHASHDRRRA
jgi:GntR family transcriptional regulator